MRIETGESFNTDQAAQKALEWCKKHEGWKRICDIDDSDSLYKTWNDLTEKEQEPWIREYGSSAEGAWGEFARKPCKVPHGYITGKGEFYKDILQVPLYHNLMTVYKVCKVE